MTEQLEGGKDDSDRGGLPAVTDHDIIGAIKVSCRERKCCFCVIMETEIVKV